MGTTDITDDTDEEQRRISGGADHFAIFHQLFYPWNRCDPWSLSSFFDCG
jgi:hypothetical protein